MFIAGSLEQNIGIIAACIPCLPHLFRSTAAKARADLGKGKPSSYKCLGDSVDRIYAQALSGEEPCVYRAEDSAWTRKQTGGYTVSACRQPGPTRSDDSGVALRDMMRPGNIVLGKGFEVDFGERKGDLDTVIANAQ